MGWLRYEVNDPKQKRRRIMWSGLIWFLSCTWGIVMTVCGLSVAAVLCCKGYKPQHYKGFLYFEVGKKWGGINLGPVFVVNQGASDHILQHELGHGLQNIVYGFLMPVLVGIPSFTRAQWRKHIRATDYAGYLKMPPYESIWFEAQATKWGTWFCK